MVFQTRISQCLCLIAIGVMSLASTGCQTQMGGQTLPSAFYLRDDVQYFPHGPEELLPNQERALAEYRAEQEAGRQRVDNR
ncbi:MAG: hypothetical protein KDA78_14385 [Planctomycetaceae bacterium]|nr:hypothetical protein [Planctomycetaceae bacterium]